MLEKESDAKRREDNQTTLIYIDKEAQIDEILDAIENPKGWKSRFRINVVRQGELPRKDKWIKPIFKTDEVEKPIVSSPLVTRISDLFDARYGNISGVSARGGTGADKFFYLTKKEAEKRELTKDYLHPLLTRPRYSRFFAFKEKDWRELANKDNLVTYSFVINLGVSYLKM